MDSPQLLRWPGRLFPEPKPIPEGLRTPKSFPAWAFASSCAARSALGRNFTPFYTRKTVLLAPVTPINPIPPHFCPKSRILGGFCDPSAGWGCSLAGGPNDDFFFSTAEAGSFSSKIPIRKRLVIGVLRNSEGKGGIRWRRRISTFSERPRLNLYPY